MLRVNQTRLYLTKNHDLRYDSLNKTETGVNYPLEDRDESI